MAKSHGSGEGSHHEKHEPAPATAPIPAAESTPVVSASPIEPAALQPAEIAAQNVAEMFRDPLRRTRGLEEYLSYIRYAFFAGMAYQVSTASQSPSFASVNSGATYRILEQEPRYWNLNTNLSEP